MKDRMNRIACKLTAAAVVFGLTVWLPPWALQSHSCESARVARRPSDALPALQGEKAVEKLKERGLYASLQEVMDATRFTHQQKLTANDEAVRWFGHSIAISGDTVVVGTPVDAIGSKDQGSAYVFVRDSGPWRQQQKLTAGDFAADGDLFGQSVAISGDTIVVGAPRDDIGSNKDQGSAYVFARNGESWNQLRNLAADDGALGDKFGVSVAISGNTVVVGAHYNDKRQGSAYAFSQR
jgi:FG-GAP repeat